MFSMSRFRVRMVIADIPPWRNTFLAWACGVNGSILACQALRCGFESGQVHTRRRARQNWEWCHDRRLPTPSPSVS